MSRRIPVDSESTRVVVHTADPWHSQVTNLEPCSILKLMTILITWSVLTSISRQRSCSYLQHKFLYVVSSWDTRKYQGFVVFLKIIPDAIFMLFCNRCLYNKESICISTLQLFLFK